MMTVKPVLSDPAYRRAIIETISPPRFGEYLRSSGGDETEALRLYFFNVGISAEFFRYLQLLEVGLRNALNRELTVRYGMQWYQRHDINLSPQTLLLVERAERILRDQRKPLTAGRVVAELSFGFWVKLLGPGWRNRYEHSLWVPALHKAFAGARSDPALPSFTRKDVFQPIDALLLFRNRIAHHEPIYRRHLAQDRNSLIRVASWLDPALGATIASGSRCTAMLGLISHDPSRATYVVDRAFDLTAAF
jgi:hypothetical protein